MIASFTVAMPALAATAETKTDAEIITELGMFGAEHGEIGEELLNSQPTRLKAAYMLLRLLGREDEAKSFVPPEGFQNYNDAADLQAEDAAVLAYLKSHPEIGFAGVKDDLFAPYQKLTEEQYKRAMLVALGCANGETGDFTEEALDAYANCEELLIAADTSAEEWKSKADFICPNGEISRALRAAITLGNGIFCFAPGEYWIEGTARSLLLGSNTRIIGATPVTQPGNPEEMLYPDPAAHAVFVTRTGLDSRQPSNESQTGFIRTAPGAENIVISDIALSGHTVLKLDSASNCRICNVLIHNYRGVYPNGQWCNMGYGLATASLWLYGNCSDITILNCQIQCSSHHGLALHSGSNACLSKNICIAGCRALYCGCGQLRGETAAQQEDAELRVPETSGYGYRDWSVAFDLCENQSVQNVTLEDCYALEGWKAGFYTEPEGTGGHIENLSLIRCRSDKAGQRAVIPGSDPKATIPKETEGSNFYVQGGYFEDCVSVEGEKCGWYIDSNRIGANPTGEGKTQLVRCGDLGSPISLVTEMFDCSQINSDGFWSINAKDWAMWLFGGNPADNWPGNEFILKNTLVAVPDGRNHPVIKIGYMLRQQLRESRDPGNQALVAPGGKYDILRAHLTDSLITGRILNLPDGVAPVEIVEGATFNGFGAENIGSPENGIELNTKETVQDINGLINKCLGNVLSNRSIPVKGWVMNKDKEEFTFNDLAAVTVQVLKSPIKDGSRSLIAKLVEDGSISEDAAVESTLYTPPAYGYIDSSRTYYSKPPFVSLKAGNANIGTVNIQMDATPRANNIDGVIAYADSSMNVTGFGNLAMLVRFNTDGYFDARNGPPGNNTQQCLNKVCYTANMKYHIEIIADMDAKLYSVYVTPEGGQTTEIAKDYGFRSTAAAATDDIGQVFFISEYGTGLFKVENHIIEPVQ